MAVSLVYRPSLTIEVYHRNQPNTSKLALYEPLHSPFITVYINNKTMYYKIECGMCVLRYFKRRADLGMDNGFSLLVINVT